jgi:protein involved in ribonucleotide reduction
MNNALLFIPHVNFDQTVFTLVRNLLMRKRIKCFVISDFDSTATGSNGMKVQPDVKSYNVNPRNFEMLIIIGSAELESVTQKNSVLNNIIERFNSNNKKIITIKSGSVLFANSFNLETNISAADVCKPYLVKTAAKPIDSDIEVAGNLYSTRSSLTINELFDLVLNN